MRLMTWNCRVGGFRRKSEFVSRFKPDILAVQEVEPLERLTKFAGELQPTFKDRIPDPTYSRRGIGTFSYTDLRLRPVDTAEPMPAFRRYEAEAGDLVFNVVAVWPAATSK